MIINIDNSKYVQSFCGPECYVGMGHINQTRLGANGQKALEMTVYTMAQEEGENRPSALTIHGCGLYKASYFDRVRPKKLTYSLQQCPRTKTFFGFNVFLGFFALFHYISHFQMKSYV